MSRVRILSFISREWGRWHQNTFGVELSDRDALSNQIVSERKKDETSRKFSIKWQPLYSGIAESVGSSISVSYPNQLSELRKRGIINQWQEASAKYGGNTLQLIDNRNLTGELSLKYRQGWEKKQGLTNWTLSLCSPKLIKKVTSGKNHRDFRVEETHSKLKFLVIQENWIGWQFPANSKRGQERFSRPFKIEWLTDKVRNFSRICQEALIKHIIKLRKLGKRTHISWESICENGWERKFVFFSIVHDTHRHHRYEDQSSHDFLHKCYVNSWDWISQLV